MRGPGIPVRRGVAAALSSTGSPACSLASLSPSPHSSPATVQSSGAHIRRLDVLRVEHTAALDDSLRRLQLLSRAEDCAITMARGHGVRLDRVGERRVYFRSGSRVLWRTRGLLVPSTPMDNAPSELTDCGLQPSASERRLTPRERRKYRTAPAETEPSWFCRDATRFDGADTHAS